MAEAVKDCGLAKGLGDPLYPRREKRAEIEKIYLRLQRLLDSFHDAVIEREDYTAEKTKLMSQKKTLEEQIAALSARRADWLEPFQKWILSSKKWGEIAVSGSLQQKSVLSFEVFGPNLVFGCKKTVVLA